MLTESWKLVALPSELDMNTTCHYAFYGSLRRGLHNHERFQSNLHYRFSTWLRGYQLFSLGDFPFAIKTNRKEDRIFVEVFKVTDESTILEIDHLELGYGYFSQEILIDKVQAKIYLFAEQANYPLVPGGDWVKFFRP